MIDVKRFRDLGYKAAQRKSRDLRDFGNGKEAAAQMIAQIAEFHSGAFLIAEAVSEIQARARIDVSEILSLSDEEQVAALAAFAGGCYAFGQEAEE